MNYRIFSTCLDRERDAYELILKYPKLINFNFSTKEVDYETYFYKRKLTIAIITVNTIDELMNLIESIDPDHETEIIIGYKDDYCEMPYIEIHDGYRE